MTGSIAFLRPGEGPNYEWENDHTFVKVAAATSGGAYTLMEDNLKASFALGLHLHRDHAETFYILAGSVDFYIDGAWMTAESGSTLHVPPNIPHACMVTPGCAAARMLMIFQPAGFDLYLEALSAMTAADFADEAKVTALSERFDIIQLGPVPDRA